LLTLARQATDSRPWTKQAAYLAHYCVSASGTNCLPLVCSSYKEWQHDKEAGTTGGQSSDAAGSGSSDVANMGDAARGLGQEAADSARSAKDLVKMEGQAAGNGGCYCQQQGWGRIHVDCILRGAE
jgi:hypothetical protein